MEVKPGGAVPTCQRCNDRPATVHFTKVTNGEKSDRFLCEVCAKEEGAYHFMLAPQFTVQQVLGGFIGQSPGITPVDTTHQCPVCGWTYQRFAETGRLGCDRCYQTFAEPLEPLVRRLQGSLNHRGKIPIHSGKMWIQEEELEKLRQKLRQAIQAEAFEEAATLRDQIRGMEEAMKTGGDAHESPDL